MTVPFAQLPLHYALQSGLSPQMFSEGESTFLKRVKSKNAYSSYSPVAPPQRGQRQRKDPATTSMDKPGGVFIEPAEDLS